MFHCSVRIQRKTRLNDRVSFEGRTSDSFRLFAKALTEQGSMSALMSWVITGQLRSTIGIVDHWASCHTCHAWKLARTIRATPETLFRHDFTRADEHEVLNRNDTECLPASQIVTPSQRRGCLARLLVVCAVLKSTFDAPIDHACIFVLRGPGCYDSWRCTTRWTGPWWLWADGVRNHEKSPFTDKRKNLLRKGSRWIHASNKEQQIKETPFKRDTSLSSSRKWSCNNKTGLR